jgi:hypothetical protein
MSVQNMWARVCVSVQVECVVKAVVLPRRLRRSYFLRVSLLLLCALRNKTMLL